jgi:hypothetical protein
MSVDFACLYYEEVLKYEILLTFTTQEVLEYGNLAFYYNRMERKSTRKM